MNAQPAASNATENTAKRQEDIACLSSPLDLSDPQLCIHIKGEVDERDLGNQEASTAIILEMYMMHGAASSLLESFRLSVTSS